MKKEFFKLLKNTAVRICIISIISIIFLYSFYYLFNKQQQTDYLSYDIEEYQSAEEIQYFIQIVDNQINELDVQLQNGSITLENYNVVLKEQLQLKSIYQYLYDNNIPYDTLGEISSFLPFSNNNVVYLENCITLLLLLLVITSLIFVIAIINYEFDKNVHKIVYMGVKNRLKIVFRKYLVFLIMITAMVIITSLLISILSLAFDNSFQNLIFLNGDTVYSISTTNFVLTNFAMMFFNVLYWGSCFFFIAIIFKNIYASLSVSLIYFVVFQKLITYIPTNIAEAFEGNIFHLNVLGVTYSEFFIALIIKLVLLALFVMIVLLRVNREDY